MGLKLVALASRDTSSKMRVVHIAGTRQGDTIALLGIRYATAQRWAQPDMVKAWVPHKYEATSYFPSCPQPPNIEGTVDQSEDCKRHIRTHATSLGHRRCNACMGELRRSRCQRLDAGIGPTAQPHACLYPRWKLRYGVNWRDLWRALGLGSTRSCEGARHHRSDVVVPARGLRVVGTRWWQLGLARPGRGSSLPTSTPRPCCDEAARLRPVRRRRQRDGPSGHAGHYHRPTAL